MSVQSIRCAFCIDSREIETKNSLIVRSVAAALGLIAATVGALFLGVPQLCAASYSIGGSLFGCGVALLFVGACIRHVKKANVSHSQAGHLPNNQEGADSALSQFEMDQELLETIDFLDHYEPPTKEDSFSPEAMNVTGKRSKLRDYITAFFKKKLQEESALSPKVIGGNLTDSTLVLNMVFPTSGKFECHGSFIHAIDGRDEILNSRRGHYKEHDFIELKLPWYKNKSFPERMDLLWQQCKNALCEWETIRTKIESACYKSNQCVFNPSNSLTDIKFFLNDVSIKILQENMCISFFPDIEAKQKNSENITLCGLKLTFMNTSEFIADAFLANLSEMFQKLFEEEMGERARHKQRRGWFDDFSFGTNAETITEVSLEEIQQLDQLLGHKGALTAAYEKQDRTAGLALISPKIIRKKCLKMHPDRAGQDKAKQEKLKTQFQTFQELVASVKLFFENLSTSSPLTKQDKSRKTSKGGEGSPHSRTVESPQLFDHLQNAIACLDHYQPPSSQDYINFFIPPEKHITQKKFVIEDYILNFFEKKQKEEAGLLLNALFCNFCYSRVEFQVILHSEGLFQCRDSFSKRSNGRVIEKINPSSGHYPNSDYITIVLPWSTQAPFEERVTSAWEQFRTALAWWNKMQEMIESVCYDGDKCNLTPSKIVAKKKFYLECVKVIAEQNKISALIYPCLDVELENSQRYSLGSMSVTVDHNDLVPEGVLSTLSSSFRMNLETHLKLDTNIMQMLIGGEWFNFEYLLSFFNENAHAISLEEITQLDQMLDAHGQLIQAYETNNKNNGLSLMTPSIIRKKSLKFHPDRAGVDVEQQKELTIQFMEYKQLVENATGYFKNLSN